MASTVWRPGNIVSLGRQKSRFEPGVIIAGSIRAPRTAGSIRLAHRAIVRLRCLAAAGLRPLLERVPYKTAVRMLDRVCDPLITYKGSLSEKKFGKPITYYITAKARRTQPRLRFPQHPSNPYDRKDVGRRYARWKERLELDQRATPEPRGVLAALARPDAQKENLDRTERLLMVLLQADPTKVKAARKLRRKWGWHRARLYDWRSRSRASKGAPAIPTPSGILPV